MNNMERQNETRRVEGRCRPFDDDDDDDDDDLLFLKYS